MAVQVRPSNCVLRVGHCRCSHRLLPVVAVRERVLGAHAERLRLAHKQCIVMTQLALQMKVTVQTV